VNQQLYLVPSFFQNKPLERLLGPGIHAAHLNDDVWGRTLDALYAYGVTPLYSLLAAQAAQRLGLSSHVVHLDTTSFHVDGRYNSDEAPDDQVVHITHGYSRDHRPDLHQVMLELIVEHQAGIPVLMKPLSGNTHDGVAFGQVIRDHVQQLHTPLPVTSLVADSALYSAENLTTLATSGLQWITRVPATLHEAQEVLAQVHPSTLAPLTDGYRYAERAATYAGIAQRWIVVSSEARQARVRRTVDKQVGTAREAELKAFKELCRSAFACAADAHQALCTVQQRLQATQLEGATIRTVAGYGKRGRPTADTVPDKMAYRREGALASSRTYRQAVLDAKSCFLLATNVCDPSELPAAEILTRYKSQSMPERSFRFLKDPRFLASSLYLKRPERIMALLMVMTLCLLVYAALEYRIRQALRGQQETFPDQKGRPSQQPTARWIFHAFVGIHVRLRAGATPLVLNLNTSHQLVLKLLGTSYEALYT
jgi:transposase